MSESCNLYLNPKWRAREIKELVERITGKTAKWYHFTNEGNYCLLTVEPDISISCFFNSQTPLGAFTHLSRGAQGVDLFRQIAETLGGLLQESDYEGQMNMISGKLSENNGLPYFVRYAIIHDGIEEDGIEAFLDSMGNWYDEIDRRRKPKFLIERDNQKAQSAK